MPTPTHASALRGDFHTDPRTGSTHDRAGRRLAALPTAWLEALRAASADDDDDDTAGLREAGRRWGRAFAERFLLDLSGDDGDYLGRPLAEFVASLDAAFARHGWGRLDCDFTAGDQGRVVVSWAAPVADGPLAEGLLAGLFSHVAARELDCERDRDGRFVLTA